jgi:hypothetical protein
MEVDNTLKSFISNKNDEVSQVYSALFIKFEVVDRTLAFIDANDFSGESVDYD